MVKQTAFMEKMKQIAGQVCPALDISNASQVGACTRRIYAMDRNTVRVAMMRRCAIHRLALQVAHVLVHLSCALV